MIICNSLDFGLGIFLVLEALNHVGINNLVPPYSPFMIYNKLICLAALSQLFSFMLYLEMVL